MSLWSAVIPVSGRPELLKEALLSALNQTLPPAEIVTVIDSTGPERKKDLAAVQYIQHVFPESGILTVFSDALGPGPARNLGVSRCTSEWVAFLDSDDLWLPEKAETQMQYLAKRPFLHLCHTKEIWLKNGEKLSPPARLSPVYGRCLTDSFSACLISPSSAVIRRSVFLELGGFDPDFPVCEDYEFWIRFLSRYSAGFIPAPLTVKRSGNWPQLTSVNHSMDLYRAEALRKNAEAALWEPEIRKLALAETDRKTEIVRSGRDKRIT